MKELDVCPNCGAKLEICSKQGAFNGNGILVRCTSCDFHSCTYASEDELCNVWCNNYKPINRMRQIAKILGLELNEPFVIYNRSTRMTVILNEYGLNVLDSINARWCWDIRKMGYEKYEYAMASVRLLGRIMIGEFLIERIPKDKWPSLEGITLEKRVDFSRCRH